ncbi:MAG: DNA repair protein RecO [Bacteroidales bacterium]|nr:DNA repair protein RecO [Bacteroidales bacterium]
MTPTLSTPALVLHTTAYSETSVIAKLFTRQLGVRSYILKGVRKGGSKTKQNLLQPLRYLDLVVYNNPKTQLNYLKEVAPHIGEVSSVTASMEDEAVRNAVVFFMTELLYKSLREEEPDQPLFDYVVESLARLQEPAAASYGHFPILFMLRLSHHLGIEPMDNYSAREPLFDLREGCFCYAADNTLTPSASLLLHTYLQAIHDDTECPLTTLSQRTELINRLLDYFQLHLSEFHNFKSHEILHTVLQ